MYLYVPEGHPLSIRSSIDLSEVADEDLILVNTQSGLRTQVEEALQRLSKTPHIAFEANSCDVVIKYVSQGHGIAILPQSNPVYGSRVKEIQLKNPALSRTVYLSWLPNLHVPQDIIDALHAVVAAMSSEFSG